MLKTIKNGSGIRVDPPPVFQISHIFPFFFGNVPQSQNTYLSLSRAITFERADHFYVTF